MENQDYPVRVRVAIGRSPEEVWAYVTEVQHWNEWNAASLSSAEWEEGGKLNWKVGGFSSILAPLTPARIMHFQLVGAFTQDTVFTLEPSGDGRSTEFTVQERYAGVSLSDGGATKRARWESDLARLKKLVEGGATASSVSEEGERSHSVAPDAAPPAWYADPLGRHQYRYWDGTSWTHHVADDGKASVDPLVQAPRETTSTTAAVGGQDGDREQSDTEPVKVKKLRELTGAGFRDAIRVLRDCGGDTEAAVEALKARGLADTGRTAEQDRDEVKSSDQLRCVTCSKVLEDWHYGFESVVLSRTLGWQCSNCGQVFCEEHAPSTFQNQGDKCSCGGWVAIVERGPALSSMVDAANRDGKYGRHLHAPGSKRNVRQE